METKKKYNNISEKLKQIIKENAPKDKQIVEFEMHSRNISVKEVKGAKVTQYANSVRIPSECTILDPGTGEYVNIAYLKNDASEELENIYITGEEGGRLRVSNSPRDIKLFQYLFLCNYNESNKDKDWHVTPSEYKFKQLKPAQTAKEKLDFELSVMVAKDAIMKFEESLLRAYAVGIGLPINPYTDPAEIRVMLMKRAETKPKEILDFDRDFEKKFALWTKRLEEQGIIQYKGSKWMWSNTEDVILTVGVGKKKNDALRDFLEDHEEVRQTLNELLEKEPV